MVICNFRLPGGKCQLKNKEQTPYNNQMFCDEDKCIFQKIITEVIK